MRHTVGVANGNFRSGYYLQELRNVISAPVTDREEALSNIEKIMGSESFGDWYREVHKLRQSGNQIEYEFKIFEKLEKLNNAMSDVSDSKICRKYGDAL